jgi:hypothetical protein
MGAHSSTPHHDEIVAAVAETGDAELASWVEQPGDYVVSPVALDAERHAFFSLTPVPADHPIGVLLVRGAEGLAVASGRPEVVWRVLRSEPTLRGPDDIVALLAPSWDDVAYVGPGSAPPVVADGDGWRCDLLVRRVGGRDRERWQVQLGPVPSWEVERA